MHTANICSAEREPTSVPIEPIPNHTRRELRMVVTQRCNYGCSFCHKEGMCNSPADKLSASDFGFLFQAGASLGLKETTLSGGEPLIRNDVQNIAEEIREGGGAITVTTNGVLLEKRKAIIPLVKRFNVSLHSLDPRTYEQIVQRRSTLAQVLNNIRAISRTGKADIRLNAALQKGLNDAPHQIDQYLRFAQENGASVKYLELYPPAAPGFVPLDTVQARLLDAGYTAKGGDARSVKLTKKNSADVLLSKIFCAHAAESEDPGKTCREQNDIFVSPDGALKPCRELPLEIDALADIKARDIVGVQAKIREAFACLGQNCPLQK